MEEREADFSGYASKAGLLCSDGRTIMAHAFKSNHGQRVPLVWNHIHDDPDKVLGHAYIEDRPDGTYVRGYLNDTPNGENVKKQLAHGDYDALSVYANKLIQKGADVVHGIIREVSLVLAGANPGAVIESVAIQHADGSVIPTDSEAVIHTGLKIEVGTEFLEHHITQEDDSEQKEGGDMAHAEEDDETIGDVLATLTDKQRSAVEHVIESAVRDGIEIGDDYDDDDDDTPDDVEYNDDKDNDDTIEHNDKQGDSIVTHTVFDKNTREDAVETRQHLSHSQIETILDTAKRPGHTLKTAVLAHADEYGITNIDYAFPDARLVGDMPQLLSRQMEWVSEVIGKTNHAPYTRIKTIVADITAEEARAKGYQTGELKKEEIVKFLQRKTDPTTIYKKQKLDRDNILDATEMDVVTWLWGEMLLMLNEEIARAILLGDGRAYNHDDKVDEDSIRPIANDAAFYSVPVTIPTAATAAELEELIIRAHDDYRGSGNPTAFMQRKTLTDLLLQKDTLGRRIHANVSDLASALMVNKIVTVEPMADVVYGGLEVIVVNLSDYTVGTDKGGAITKFEDFDIDYNQHKYLAETRMSGALVRPSSALVFRRQAAREATPTMPPFADNTITIPVIAGVIYSIDGDTVTGEVEIDRDTEVTARPAPTYAFPAGATTHWNYTYTP